MACPLHEATAAVALRRLTIVVVMAYPPHKATACGSMQFQTSAVYIPAARSIWDNAHAHNNAMHQRQSYGSKMLAFSIPAYCKQECTQERQQCTQERQACTQERQACTQERQECTQEQQECTQERQKCTQERQKFTMEQQECMQARQERTQERQAVVMRNARMCCLQAAA